MIAVRIFVAEGEMPSTIYNPGPRKVHPTERQSRGPTISQLFSCRPRRSEPPHADSRKVLESPGGTYTPATKRPTPGPLTRDAGLKAE